ncbi:DUF397 domain-containing protein [Nocardiopsis sp. CNR-923]|nr:DUF397 domain-containing protein [Nocardiopsis sp. CNR-923]
MEVREGDSIRVRDTRNRHLGYLAVPAGEWTALLVSVRVDR